MEKPAALDRNAALTLVAIAEAQALLLYIAAEAHEKAFGLFTDRAFLTLWYSLAIIPPGLVSLTLRDARDRFAWLAGLAAVLVIGLLAWHTGSACGNDTTVACDEVVGPYVPSLLIGCFILLPFVQGFRDHRWKIPYATLFHSAWDNALVVAAMVSFTGAAWLILVLWAALFKLIGIAFFQELFSKTAFIYPVTGLLAGFGLVLARHQAGALKAVLRLCLSLGRGLLPIICVLALVFLGTLMSTGLQPLWDTDNATALLLLLVFGTVSLVNGVLHDGTGVDGYRPALRRLLGAALFTLPVYSVMAAVATSLRVQQYGWTVARLWAATLVFIALAYAFAYAASAAFKHQGRWLGLLPRANIAVALGVGVIVLATQSPLLDFRAITVRSQLARLDAGKVTPADFDYRYFRWELGRPGYEALNALKDDPRITADPALANRVGQILAATERWSPLVAQAPLDLERLIVLPKGATPPAELLGYINSRDDNYRDCPRDRCVLLGTDLAGDAALEWALIDTRQDGSKLHPVFRLEDGDWRRAGYLDGELDDATRQALTEGRVRTEPGTWKDLVIGGKRLHVERYE